MALTAKEIAEKYLGSKNDIFNRIPKKKIDMVKDIEGCENAREIKYYEWTYKSTLLLAVEILRLQNLQSKIDGNTEEWPAQQEWVDLSGSSKAIFINKACTRSGIDRDEWLAIVRICNKKYEVAAEFYKTLSIGKWKDIKTPQQ